MPYPNFHSARVRDPDDFARIVVLDTLDNGIMVYGGPLKSDPDGDSKPQAYRFPKDKFTIAEAKKWLKDHKIKWIEFEPASESKSEAPDIERRFIEPVEVRLIRHDDKAAHLIGYAAVFNKLSDVLGGRFREKIEPGAFTKSLKRDDVRALVDHDPTRILGRNIARTLQLHEDKTGLHYDVELPDTTVGRDVGISVERGDISGSSFGFVTISDEWHTEEQQDVRTLKEVKLIDVSPCTFPAYPDTSVAVRSLEEWSKKQTEIDKEEDNKTGQRDLMRMRLALAERI